MGEYGVSLLDGTVPSSGLPQGDGNSDVKSTTPVVVTEEEVVQVYQKILWSHHISVITKQVRYVH